jgi:hypothetical protein
MGRSGMLTSPTASTKHSLTTTLILTLSLTVSVVFDHGRGRVEGLSQLLTIPDHILGSLADTHLLNPTVMVHTTVSPALHRRTISLVRANLFHGVGTFPRCILRLLLPYGDCPSNWKRSSL